jgi:hypothetical protein
MSTVFGIGPLLVIVVLGELIDERRIEILDVCVCVTQRRCPPYYLCTVCVLACTQSHCLVCRHMRITARRFHSRALYEGRLLVCTHSVMFHMYQHDFRHSLDNNSFQIGCVDNVTYTCGTHTASSQRTRCVTRDKWRPVDLRTHMVCARARTRTHVGSHLGDSRPVTLVAVEFFLFALFRLNIQTDGFHVVQFQVALKCAGH